MLWKNLILVAAAGVALYAVPAHADEGEGGRARHRQRVLERFDANGDGRLDDAERERARESMRDRRGRRDGEGRRGDRGRRRGQDARRGRGGGDEAGGEARRKRGGDGERCESCGRRNRGETSDRPGRRRGRRDRSE